MIDQVERNINLREFIFNPQSLHQKEIKLNNDLTQQLQSSNKKIFQLSKLQAANLKPKQYSSHKFKRFIRKFDRINQNEIVSQQKITIQKLIQFSIYKDVSVILLENIISLVEIQNNIDPINQKLIQFDGTPIHQLVTDSIKTKKVDKMFNMIFSKIANSNVYFKQELKRQFLHKILQKTLKFVQFFHYMIPQQVASLVVLNKNMPPIYQDFESISKRQGELVKARLIQSTARYGTQFQTSFVLTLINLIKRKKQFNQKVIRFFSQVTPSDYEKMFNDTIDLQIQQITK